MTWRAVTETPWERMDAQLPPRHPHRRGGRPRLSDRQGFEGMLWMLWTGAPWSERPVQYGSKSAVHSRLAAWATNGVRLHVWRALLAQRNNAQKLRWNACCVAGIGVTAKTGATVWA
jgi:transposase